MGTDFFFWFHAISHLLRLSELAGYTVRVGQLYEFLVSLNPEDSDDDGETENLEDDGSERSLPELNVQKIPVAHANPTRLGPNINFSEENFGAFSESTKIGPYISFENKKDFNSKPKFTIENLSVFDPAGNVILDSMW